MPARGGASKDAAEAIGVSILMRGGPATIYGARAYTAFGEFADAVPDDDLGEHVHAAVQPARGQTISDDELLTNPIGEVAQKGPVHPYWQAAAVRSDGVSPAWQLSTAAAQPGPLIRREVRCMPTGSSGYLWGIARERFSQHSRRRI